MDATKVQEAIANSGTYAAYLDARAAMESVWLQNRKALYAMVLRGNVAEGIDAVEEMPGLIDEAIARFLELREESISLSYNVYGT